MTSAGVRSAREGAARSLADLVRTLQTPARRRTGSSPGCAPLRRARFPALAAPALLPSARSALPPPTRAHMWIGPVAMSRSPYRPASGQDDASGGGWAGTGMEGAPSPAAGP
jgi:hypothetical protein